MMAARFLLYDFGSALNPATRPMLVYTHKCKKTMDYNGYNGYNGG